MGVGNWGHFLGDRSIVTIFMFTLLVSALLIAALFIFVLLIIAPLLLIPLCPPHQAVTKLSQHRQSNTLIFKFHLPQAF